MVRSAERILLIGDRERQMESSLSQALPGADVRSVAGVFDALAELSAGNYTTVIASADPIERRPESAMRAIRQLAGDSRILLFSNPSLEPISRKMLEFGCDDYLVTPASPTELQQLFGTPPVRFATSANRTDESIMPVEVSQPSRLTALLGLPLAEMFLDSMLQHPQEAPNLVVRQINAHIGPTHKLLLSASPAAPQVGEGFAITSHVVRSQGEDSAVLHLMMPRDEDETSARHVLSQISLLIGKCLALRERHKKMLKLAFTDDLTGIANGRWFRQHLEHKISEAKEKYLLVTLLIFDIDNFKQYNDQFGHGVGDEILKQTASLIKRCVRPTDLVARISGDEFAIVFFDPDGPREPRDPSVGTSRSRVPPSVQAVCERIRRLISAPEYQLLGTNGQGMLTISGGIAVYPYDAQSSEALICAADKALMFDAKRGGKNSITLVGEESGEGFTG